MFLRARAIRGKQWLRVVNAASIVAEGSERVNCDYVPSHTNDTRPRV